MAPQVARDSREPLVNIAASTSTAPDELAIFEVLIRRVDRKLVDKVLESKLARACAEREGRP
jgi:hypothetical protein